MFKSRAITLTVLSGLMLTGCCVTSLGCGRTSAQRYETPDHTWYDANGNAIPEKWKTDPQGNRVLDAEGRPIPDPHVPYDRQHRPWVYTNGAWAPLLIPLARSSSSYSRTTSWLTGGSGYRSTSSSSNTTYRSATGSGSSSLGSSSSTSSISRGGFGSTGSSSGSSS